MSGDKSWRYVFFFFEAEDGIPDVERFRGLGGVYKRQVVGESHSQSITELIIRFIQYVSQCVSEAVSQSTSQSVSG